MSPEGILSDLQQEKQQMLGQKIIGMMIEEYEASLKKLQERSDKYFAANKSKFDNSDLSYDDMFQIFGDVISFKNISLIEFAVNMENKLVEMVVLEDSHIKKPDISENAIKFIKAEDVVKFAENNTETLKSSQQPIALTNIELYKPIVDMHARLEKFTNDCVFDRAAFEAAMQKDSKLQEIIAVIVSVLTLGQYETKYKAAHKVKSFAAKIEEGREIMSVNKNVL